MNLKSLFSNVTRLLNKSVSTNYISNECITTIDSLKDAMEFIERITNDANLANQISVVLRKDKQYNAFYKKLIGHNASEETRKIFSSLKKIIEVYIYELEHLVKYVTNNEEVDSFIEIQNIKYSQTAFVGLMYQGILIDRFAKAFIFKACYFKNIDNFKKDYPWLFKVIDEQNSFVTDQINSYANVVMKKTTFVDKILNCFKQQNYDPVILNNNQPNEAYAAIFESNTEIKKMNLFGLPFSVNVFAWGAKMYMLYAHNRNMQREYEKAWMENRVKLLMSDMQNLDSESPEYKKLEKVVSNYNHLIANVTKEIDEYRNS